MPPQNKPYRRFKARGAGTPDEGIEGLRRLAQGESVAERPAPAKVDARDPWEPTPPRHWWSLRGLGVWGFAWRVGILLVVGVTTWGVFGFLAINGAVSTSNARITPSAKKALTVSGGLLSSTQNTLLIGADSRPGETRSRADSIMVMRTDPGGGKIKWLSIPRDFRVDLPVTGVQKINAAYFFSGQKGMIRAVENLTGLQIHHIVVVNFRGVRQLVNDLGGITVNNPTTLTNCAYPGGITVSFPKGDISLNGDEALQFVRVRKCDDDFRRAARQQAFMAALKGAMTSIPSLPWAPWNGAAAIRAIGTDMGAADLLKLGWLQWRLSQDPKDRIVLAGIPRYVGGVSYVVGEPDTDEQQIADFVRR